MALTFDIAPLRCRAVPETTKPFTAGQLHAGARLALLGVTFPDTPEAQAGLACTSCHAITAVHSSMGNGDFTIEYPPLHELLASKNPMIRRMDRFLTYMDPEPHKKTFMKPFMRDNSEFCASCHKVHLDVPVNSYRWSRGFNSTQMRPVFNALLLLPIAPTITLVLATLGSLLSISATCT